MSDAEAKADPFFCPRCAVDAAPTSETVGNLTFNRAGRRCAFNRDGKFHPDNWMCGTLEVLRNSVYDTPLNVRTCDETVDLIPWRGGGDGFPLPGDFTGHVTHVVLGYYKDRGTTKGAVMMESVHNSFVPLTLDVASAFADAVEALDRK